MRAACVSLILVSLILIAAISATSTAQDKSSAVPDKLSTAEGVYSREQAVRGEDAYMGYCRSCHTPESHNSDTFVSTWNGKPLAELFDYILERMPKNEPGSLSRQEVVDVVAYLLRLNRMPQGTDELPADSAALKKIRFDVQKSPH